MGSGDGPGASVGAKGCLGGFAAGEGGFGGDGEDFGDGDGDAFGVGDGDDFGDGV